MIADTTLGTYARIARLLARHLGLLRDAGSARDPLAPDPDPGDDADAAAFAADLERSGPTFVKLGQVLATRRDLLPERYLVALRRLHDHVTPVPVAEVRAVVEEELGAKLDRVFPVFEETPLGSASLSQVHRAELRDGTTVAVKVQRPGLRAEVARDLDALDRLAAAADFLTDAGARLGFRRIVDEFRRSLTAELDFAQEAENLHTMRRLLADYDAIVVPRPVDDLTTARVLTMEYVPAANLEDLSGVVLADLPGQRLADKLFRAYLDQILVHGFVHADPHPGNVMLTRDHRLALVDLGMVLRVEPHSRDELLKLLLAAAEGRAREAADVAVALGERLDGFAEDRFRREIADLVGYFVDTRAGDVQAGHVVLEIARIATQCGLRPPQSLVLLGRTLANLDAVGRVLAPGFDVRNALARHAEDIMTRSLVGSLSPHALMRRALETKQLVEDAPSRLNAILGRLAEGRLDIGVAATDAAAWRTTLHRATSRLTLGIVLAAIIVGAALLMRVDAGPTLGGYPALAVVLFVAAAAGGLLLAGQIMWESWRGPNEDRPR